MGGDAIMAYRIVQIMPQIFFEQFFKEYENKYERIQNNGSNPDMFEELIRVTKGLPKDATFVEYRIPATNNSHIELVYESDEWDEDDNFGLVDVKFESITLQKSEVESLGEVTGE